MARRAMNNEDSAIDQELISSDVDEWDPFFGPPVRKGEVPPGPKPWERDIGKNITGLRPPPVQQQPQPMPHLAGAGVGQPGGYPPQQQQYGRPPSAPLSALPPKATHYSVPGGYVPPAPAAAPKETDDSDVFQEVNDISDSKRTAQQQPSTVIQQKVAPERQEQKRGASAAGGVAPAAGTAAGAPVGGGQQPALGGGSAQPAPGQQVYAKVTFADGFSGPYLAPFMVKNGDWVIVQGQRQGSVANVAAVTTVQPPVPPMGSIVRAASPSEVAQAKAGAGAGGAQPPPQGGAPGMPVQQQPQTLFAKVVFPDGRAVPCVVGQHQVAPGSSVTTNAFPGIVGKVEVVTPVAPPSAGGPLAQILSVEAASRALQVPMRQQSDRDPSAMGLKTEQKTTSDDLFDI